jgi:hypothetical protein
VRFNGRPPHSTADQFNSQLQEFLLSHSAHDPDFQGKGLEYGLDMHCVTYAVKDVKSWEFLLAGESQGRSLLISLRPWPGARRRLR